MSIIWGRKIFRKILRSRYNEQPKMAYDDFGDYGWKNTSEPSSSTQHIKLYMFLCWNSWGPITVRMKYDQKQIIMGYKATQVFLTFFICIWWHQQKRQVTVQICWGEKNDSAWFYWLCRLQYSICLQFL